MRQAARTAIFDSLRPTSLCRPQTFAAFSEAVRSNSFPQCPQHLDDAQWKTLLSYHRQHFKADGGDIVSRLNPQLRVTPPDLAVATLEAAHPLTSVHRCPTQALFVATCKKQLYGYTYATLRKVHAQWRCSTAVQPSLPNKLHTVEIAAMGYISPQFSLAVTGTFNDWDEKVLNVLQWKY